MLRMDNLGVKGKFGMIYIDRIKVWICKFGISILLLDGDVELTNSSEGGR